MNKYVEKAKKYIGVVQGDKKHKNIINYYNNHIKPLPRSYRVKLYDNWCATFVSFVLWSCGCRKNVFECSANRMYAKMVALKMLVDKSKGRSGDIIFFDWDGKGWIDHVGFIEKSDTDFYYTIEGNKGKAVRRGKVTKNSKYVTAICRVK